METCSSHKCKEKFPILLWQLSDQDTGANSSSNLDPGSIPTWGNLYVQKISMNYCNTQLTQEY